MNNEEIAWLAGILEGEACFDFNDIYRKRNPRIRLEMKDEDIITRVQALIGGKIYVRKGKRINHNTTYRLVLCQRYYLEPVLKAIYPWLGERRKKIVKDLIDWYDENPAKYDGTKVIVAERIKENAQRKKK